MNYLVAGLLTISVVNLLIFLVILYQFRKLYLNIYNFVSPQDNSESPLSQVVNLIIGRFSNQVAIELKTAIMGSISGLSRSVDSINGAIAESKAPAISGILDLFPGIKRKIVKNPLLIDLVLSQFGKNHQPMENKPVNRIPLT